MQRCGFASGSAEKIVIDRAAGRFVLHPSRRPFTVWGVNYDHDQKGRLIEDYWFDRWELLVEDFDEIRALGANAVRVHLQLGRFMAEPDRPNRRSLSRLDRLVRLAERKGLYLNLTGLSEAERWAVQARFWEAVSGVCAGSPAVFCYDLMNEPILPGDKKAETEWLAGELGGKYFVQRISLDLNGRTRQQVAAAWVRTMTSAIRKKDSRTPITVGVIPWAHVFPGARPLFYSEQVGGPLDFVSVHFYPRAGQVDRALKALAVYDLGKPLVIEEMFPLKCSIDEMVDFIVRSRKHADGWFSFYWGRTAEQIGPEPATVQDALKRNWLLRYRSLSPEMTGSSNNR